MTFNTDWPASRDPDAIGIEPFEVAGRSFPGGVKGGDAHTVLLYVAAHHHWRVESLYTGIDRDDWGYAYRENRNAAGELSRHARGIAIDVNATEHPNGARNTYTYAQVRTIRKILAECGGVVRWGGDFSTTKDEQHFEINASKADVAVVARRLRSPGWWTRELKVGMSGEDVRFVRKRLGVSDSIYYTPGVGDAVNRLRAKLHLPAGTTVSRGMAFYIGAK